MTSLETLLHRGRSLTHRATWKGWALRAGRSRALGLVILISGGALFVGGIVTSVAYPEPYRVPGFLKYCLDAVPDGLTLSEGCANVRFLVARDLGNPAWVDWFHGAPWLRYASLFATIVGVAVATSGQLWVEDTDRS
ncbi:MAG: hypothetical protein V3S98_10070 [Dehalococcoidia bacterium]